MKKTDFLKSMTEITKLDSWDIAAVLGSWQFVIQRAAINAAIRLIPDLPPEGSGIDAATQYGEDLRRVMNDEPPAELVSLVAMDAELTQAIDNYASVSQDSRGFGDTLTFLRNQLPQQNVFINDYNRRKRSGIKMAISLREFVNGEMQQALRNHQILLAKGQDAVVLLDKIAEGTPTLGDAPEWLEETLTQRAVDKLQQRYGRLEIRRTNPRLSTAQRDEAEASQALIAQCIKSFGSDIIPAEAFNSEDDDAAFLAEVAASTKTA
jgi:hypothetical protein